MRVEAVDERDTRSEAIAAHFKVLLFEGSSSSPLDDQAWATDSYDLFDCDVVEALQWCVDRAYPDQAFALGLVTHHDESGAEVVWLAGHDANDTLLSPVEARVRERMVARMGQRLRWDA